MIRLQQKVYELRLKNGSKTNLSENSKLLIVVNGKKSELLIDSLFTEGFSIYEDEAMIKGYSVLYRFQNTEGSLVYEDLVITLSEDGKEDELIFHKVRNPLIQSSDKEISDEDFKNIISELKSLLVVEANEEPPPVVLDSSKIAGQVDLASKEEKVDNKQYSAELQRLIAKNYKEVRYGNIAILSRENEKNIIVKIEKDDYLVIQEGAQEDGSKIEVIDEKLVLTT